MHRNTAFLFAALVLAAGSSAHADSAALSGLDRVQFSLSHLDPTDRSAPSVTFIAPSSRIEIRVGEDYANQLGDPLHVASEPGLLVPLSLLVPVTRASGFATLDSDPTDPGNTIYSQATASWGVGSPHPYAYAKGGISAAFVLSADTRLEITGYGNVSIGLLADSGDAEATAGLEVFSADADGNPLAMLASQFSHVKRSGYGGFSGYDQFLTIDFDNTGTQPIYGYFDGYALSAADSAPPRVGPIPEPANIILLLASLGLFVSIGAARRLHH